MSEQQKPEGRDVGLSAGLCLPREGTPLRVLGERLTHLLDDDQWNNCEPLLLKAHAEAEKLRETVQAYMDAMRYPQDKKALMAALREADNMALAVMPVRHNVEVS